jgi:hypothetical protein
MCQCLFASASPPEFLEPFATNNRFPSTARTPFSRVSQRNFDNSPLKGIDTGSCQTSSRFAQIVRLRNPRRKTREGAVAVIRVYRSDDRHDFNIIYPPTKYHTQSVGVHIGHFKMGRLISKLFPSKIQGLARFLQTTIKVGAGGYLICHRSFIMYVCMYVLHLYHALSQNKIK